MRRRSHCVRILGVVVGLCWMLGHHLSAGTEKADFLGRWDITIAETGDTFRSSWLEVTESEGKLGGKLLWKWGSVTDVKSVEVVDGELRVTRVESYEDKPVDVVYAAKLVEGKLVGSVKNPDGLVHKWTGIRDVDKLDLSGTWELMVDAPGSPKKETLILKQEGSRLSGDYLGGSPGWEYEIREGKVADSTVSFLVVYRRLTGGENLLRYSAKVEGDRMKGTALSEVAPSGGTFTAQRQRKWGKPTELFNGKDLIGFGPRDASRGFNWSVKDGILVNRPPDQDIVTEKQFKDFKLHVEFSMARGSNSGIYLRGRYELQLEDDFGRQPGKHSSSSIYSRLAPSANASKPANEWQTIDATLVGRWLTVVLNGQIVLENVHLDGITGGAFVAKGAEINDESLPGPLMFQGDHGLVRFRQIVVTPSVD